MRAKKESRTAMSVNRWERGEDDNINGTVMLDFAWIAYDPVLEQTWGRDMGSQHPLFHGQGPGTAT